MAVLELAARTTGAQGVAARALPAFRQHLDRYQADRAAALELVSQGQSARDETLDVTQLASYTMVANLILNFDGTVTKE